MHGQTLEYIRPNIIVRWVRHDDVELFCLVIARPATYILAQHSHGITQAKRFHVSRYGLHCVYIDVYGKCAGGTSAYGGLSNTRPPSLPAMTLIALTAGLPQVHYAI